jgi:RNA-directed DNA polymerase
MAYFDGKIAREEVEPSVQSWFAHLAHADTWRLHQQILADFDWLNPDDFLDYQK